MSDIAGYNIQVGQIYRPNDGGQYGHVVVDTTTYAHCDDVLVVSFNGIGTFGEPTRIDAWKLACVRYYNTGFTVRPATIPSNLMPTYENTLELLRHKRTRLGLNRNQLRRRWFFTNPEGNHYMFASFKRAGETATVCTVAWYNAIIGIWLPS